MSVQELYRGNPDLVTHLLRITGKHRLKSSPSHNHTLSPSPPLTNDSASFSPQPNSAFNKAAAVANTTVASAHEAGAVAAGDVATGLQSSIPDAFKSKATHFTPIIVSDDKKVTNSGEHDVSAASAASSKPKVRTAEDEEKVAQKIKQLKKNFDTGSMVTNIADEDACAVTPKSHMQPLTTGIKHMNKTKVDSMFVPMQQ